MTKNIRRSRLAAGIAMAAVAGAASTVLGAAPAHAAGEQWATVWATREGLVGGTTANGHIVQPRDNFVSLPSRNGLSAKGSGAMSVRVCGPDQFGRTVRNPRGFDLADGAMWDGLHAGDGAWVKVTFLWTGGGTQGQVRTAGGSLNVRTGASTGNANVGLAGPFARVPIECRVAGQTISGFVRTTSLWDRAGPGNYISDAYVTHDPGVSPRRC